MTDHTQNIDRLRAETERLRVQIDERRLNVEERKLAVEDARLALEREKLATERSKIATDAIRTSFEATIRFADMTLRSLLILNGGAALAVLTFAANRIKERAPIADGVLGDLVLTFGAGALLSVFSAGLSYLAQTFFTLTVEETKTSRLGRFFQVLAITCVIASFGAFAFGVYQASAHFRSPAAVTSPVPPAVK